MIVTESFVTIKPQLSDLQWCAVIFEMHREKFTISNVTYTLFGSASLPCLNNECII